MLLSSVCQQKRVFKWKQLHLVLCILAPVSAYELGLSKIKTKTSSLPWHLQFCHLLCCAMCASVSSDVKVLSSQKLCHLWKAFPCLQPANNQTTTQCHITGAGGCLAFYHLVLLFVFKILIRGVSISIGDSPTQHCIDFSGLHSY